MRSSANLPISRLSLIYTLQVAFAAGVWGCWSLFLRPSGLAAPTTTSLAFVIVGLAVLPLATHEPRPTPWSRTAIGMLVVYSAIDVANVLAFFAAMQFTTVAVAVLTHYLMPLVVALLAPLVEHERIPGSRSAALVATLGLALVLGPTPAGSNGWLGALLGTASALGYGCGVFLARRLTPLLGVTRTLGYHALIGGLLLAPLIDMGSLLTVRPLLLGWLGVGALVLGAGGGLLFLHGLRHIGSTRASILTFCEPMVAVTIGWIVWNERLSPGALVGAALIVLAGIWVTRSPSISVAPRVVADLADQT